MKVLIEVEHLKALKNIAEVFVEGTGGAEEQRVLDAIFVADVAIQGAETEVPA
jgi:hypothetical protein